MIHGVPAALRRRPAPATLVLVALMVAFAALMTHLALLRYDQFWAGRFDLGNMVQAVWSSGHGHLLEVTGGDGRQFNRLGAHVDPVLVAFVPLWWVWPDPRLLLVVQVLVVALGAVPTYLLGRRWTGHTGLALTGAAAYLLYPSVQWSVLTEFHPVALATPLLLGCMWAVDARRPVWCAVLATLAALTKEQVGVALAMMGVWALLRRGRGHRGYGLGLIAGGLGWSALAIGVIIPHFSPSGANPYLGRYGDLGDSQSAVLHRVLTDPVHALHIAVSGGRPGYLEALFLSLLALPLLAPLVALGALPDLALNLLAHYWPQYSPLFQYTDVISAFLVAACVGGLARAHRLLAARWRVPRVSAAAVLGTALLAAVLVGGYRQGPMPFWPDTRGAWSFRSWEFRTDPHAAAQAAALRVIPTDPGVPVSASNPFGARLSARRYIYSWPVTADAQWVVVDERRPYVADRVDAAQAAPLMARLRLDPRFRLVWTRDGVEVYRRVPGGGAG